MRFRATIDNASTFHRIIQSIEKLQKKCVIKFTETNINLICNSDTNEGGIQVWSQIKVDSLFSGYRIQSNANNEITLTLSAEALMSALRSAALSSTGANSSYTTEEIIMKLAKKNDQAVLSFEINGTTRQNRRVKVTHDVKIEVMRPSDVERLNEPLCPEPDVHILLPPLQKMRTIVEKLRGMSDVMAVRANNNKCLQLAVHTEAIKLETQWTDCTNPSMAKDPADSQSDDPPPEPDQMFNVLVSTRSFLKFLNSHVVSTTTIACICQNHCMILYVYIGDVVDAGGVLTFYIPAILDS
ncbi:cell cycle checkpoint [Cylindrobasidium torrendii FP15055 ss-10]|uniref:Checkpoint protein n=1 Tax=Cylindrobasidium torrendii FP15055 ss-10 TaxID=1314674 RepID=A0A0D7BNJ7_9AGAR|nr:cell cycle checkpoint [Cylindrobasidium torrendii FP15055 ss-10]